MLILVVYMNSPCLEYSNAFENPFGLVKDRDVLGGWHIHIVSGTTRLAKPNFIKRTIISIL